MKKEWSLPGRACWILCLTVAIAMVQVQEVRSQTTTQRMTRLTLVEQNTPFGTVSLIAPVGAGSYQLTMPASAPGQGSLLYLSNGSGQLAWTTAPAANQVLTTNGSGQPTWVANSTFLGNTWSITGNTGMDTSAQYIGTTDALPIIVRTNGTERLRVRENGNVGIGTTGNALTERLTVSGGNVLLANTGTRAELRLMEASANGTNFVGIRAASAMASDITLAMPATAPTSGTYLKGGSTTATDLEWSDLGIPRVVVKGADEQVVSTLLIGQGVQDDDNLVLAVSANAIYVFEMFIAVSKTAVLAAGDIVMQFDGPAGTTGTFGFVSSGAALGQGVVQALGVATPGIGVTALGGGNITSIHIRGIVRTGANAGNLQYRWGMGGIALINTLTVYKDSYMQITRIQ